MRTPLALATVLLAATTLSACGGSDSGSDSGSGSESAGSPSSTPTQSAAERTAAYCKDYQGFGTTFEFSEAPSVDQLEKASDRIGDLADEAPEAVAAQWKVVDTGVANLVSVLKSTGITPAQFAQASRGKAPAGVSAADVKKVQAVFSSAETAGIDKAFSAIDANAKSVCKTS